MTEPMDLVRALREELGLFAGSMSCSPEEAWNEALREVRRLKEGRGVALQEDQRQAVLLALAKLSLSRPGWLDYLGRIADILDKPGRPMFNAFRSHGPELPPAGDDRRA